MLSLSHCKLSEVPPALLELRSIVTLDLSFNDIHNYAGLPLSRWPQVRWNFNRTITFVERV